MSPASGQDTACTSCNEHETRLLREILPVRAFDNLTLELQGKIVFTAPTKPLVNQQIDACYQKMGISKVGCCWQERSL